MVKETVKIRYIYWTIIGIVILTLSITVIMQHRCIHALILESNNSNPQDVNADKLNSIYIESARDILSEDEMKKFENYLTTGQSPFNMRGGPPSDRFQGGQ